MTVIIFIIVLLVTVIVHEWGHFYVARKSGMAVEEFGFGIPPRLFSWKKGETRYSINLLPIGGFVKIAGENGIEGNFPVSRQFESKPWYLKSAVLVAGVVCNILLAIFLFTAAFSIGMPVASDTGTPTIINVTPDSPSAQAGLRVGDTVKEVTVGGITLEAPFDTAALREAIIQTEGPVSITHTHLGSTKTVEVVPTGTGNSRIIGLGVSPVSVERLPVHKAFVAALQQTWTVAGQIFVTLGSLIQGIFSPNDTASSLIGPVGLANEVRSAANIGFTYLLAFTAMISVNLAVINIMPFPALDGGRLVVVLLEAITRRKFSQNTIGIIHAAGFLFLLGLMVFLTIGDVRRLF